jgi:hypothetical protein
MPAIDHVRVRQQASRLATLSIDPTMFRRELRSLCQLYSDACLRQSSVVALHTPLKGYGTPQPVFKTFVQATRRALETDPGVTFALAKALWQVDGREERMFAAHLLADCVPASPYVVTETLSTWLQDLNDAPLTDTLGQTVGSALLIAAQTPVERSTQCQSWLRDSHRWTRRFGIAALQGLVSQRRTSDIHSILTALSPTMSEADAEVRGAVVTVLRELTQVAYQDVLHFMREWAIGFDRHAHWIIRQCLDSLDNDIRLELMGLMMRNNTFGKVTA